MASSFLTWDGTTRTVRLYKDGVLAGTATNASTGAVDPSGGIFRIGSYNRTSLSRVETFPGLIDEVMYFNRALSDSELATLVAGGTSCQCQAADVSAQLALCNQAKSDLAAQNTSLLETISGLQTANAALQTSVSNMQTANAALRGAEPVGDF